MGADGLGDQRGVGGDAVREFRHHACADWVRYEIKRVVNWPLIVGMASTVIYTVLFAACLSVVRTSGLNSRTALELLLAREEGAKPEA